MRAATAVGIGYGKALLAAFQFLTRLPIPVRFEYTETVCRRSVLFYPLVGAVLGLLLSLVGEGLRHVLPTLPAACLLLGLWISLTGGLHLDGLMDTADGILSHRPREQMLEIMKDSRVGAMGVIVCALQLLMKFSLLYTLLASDLWPIGSVLLLAVPLWSRWFMVAAMQGWPYARQGSGMGSFYRGLRAGHVVVSLIQGIGLTALIILAGKHLGIDFALVLPALHGETWPYIVGFPALTFSFGFGIAVYLASKLGGLTGDTYGAINEFLESLLLLAVILVI